MWWRPAPLPAEFAPPVELVLPVELALSIESPARPELAPFVQTRQESGPPRMSARRRDERMTSASGFFSAFKMDRLRNSLHRPAAGAAYAPEESVENRQVL